MQFGVLLRKKTKFLALGVAIGALLNIFANLVLIPKFHLWGAALATLISFSFLFVFIYFISQRLYYTPYQLTRLFKMYAVSLVLYLTASLVNPSSIFVSFMTKFGIALCFPIILYYWRFYKPEELRKLREIIRQIPNIFRVYILRKGSK